MIARYARRPIRPFRLVSFGVLIVSFIPDFSFAATTTAAGVPTLMVMHVVAAAITVGMRTMPTRG